MKTTSLLCLALAGSMAARADFSYTTTIKSGAGASSGTTSKTYQKGQKMVIDHSDHITILDFDAQTITMINNSQKTYSVTKFSEMGEKLSQAGADIKVDVKETGQRKTVNGYACKELVMNMDVDTPQARGGMKMQMEMDMWLSSDVPGGKERREFYQKNAGRFPWAAMSRGGNPGMQKAMADLQQKIAAMDGVPVLQVVKAKPAGNDAQMAQAQQGMAQTRTRLEEMAKQGGPRGQAAQQALARMGGASSGGSLFETTMESSNFSTSPIPDSVFAIPAGYTKTDRK